MSCTFPDDFCCTSFNTVSRPRLCAFCRESALMLAIVPTANRLLYTVSASEYGALPSSSDNAESACKGETTP